MKTFDEFLQEQEDLQNESWAVDALGHLYMGLVGAATGAVTGALGGAASKGWQGLTTGDPFHEVIKFKTAMKRFHKILNKMDPSEAEKIKSQFCQYVKQL